MLQALSTFGHIVLAVLVLLLMVTIHEFGHYLAGVVLKFKINEFSVGFGPVVSVPKFWDKEAMARIRARKKASKIEGYQPEPVKDVNRDYLFRVQRTNKRGENISLRWFPLGGYCAFAGEDDTQGNDTYLAQKPWKRLIVQFSGAMFNILSAFVFCMLLIGIVGYSVPRVGNLLPDAPVQTAVVREVDAQTDDGLRVGDVIVGVNGREITVLHSFEALMTQFYRDASGNYMLGDSYTLTVERKNSDGAIERVETTGAFRSYEYTYEEDGEQKTAVKVGLGIEMQPSDWIVKKHGFWQTIGYSFPYTFQMAGDILKEFGKLITGRAPITDLGGPVSTIAMMGEYTQLDMRYLLVLLPLIAVNLGVFNLLPIPALDGARIIFTLIEMIFRKPVPRKIEATIHSVGLLALLGLIVIFDVMHLLL